MNDLRTVKPKPDSDVWVFSISKRTLYRYAATLVLVAYVLTRWLA